MDPHMQEQSNSYSYYPEKTCQDIPVMAFFQH